MGYKPSVLNLVNVSKLTHSEMNNILDLAIGLEMICNFLLFLLVLIVPGCLITTFLI